MGWRIHMTLLADYCIPASDRVARCIRLDASKTNTRAAHSLLQLCCGPLRSILYVPICG